MGTITSRARQEMKRLINSILGRLGYRIQKKSNSSQGFTAERIRKLGKPKTIIDVGVADGTFPLYDAFPDKNIVLIEPMAEKNRESLAYIKRKYSNVFLIDKAAGEGPEETTIHCESNSHGKTSLLKRTDLTKEIAGTEKATVRERCRVVTPRPRTASSAAPRCAPTSSTWA